MEETLTAICANFIKAHQSYQLEGFAPLLSKKAILVRSGRGTITDYDVILNYLNNLSVYHRTQKVDYSIVDMPSSGIPAVKILVHNEGIIYVSFQIENNLITQITFTTEQSNASKTIRL